MRGDDDDDVDEDIEEKVDDNDEDKQRRKIPRLYKKVSRIVALLYYLTLLQTLLVQVLVLPKEAEKISKITADFLRHLADFPPHFGDVRHLATLPFRFVDRLLQLAAETRHFLRIFGHRRLQLRQEIMMRITTSGRCTMGLNRMKSTLFLNKNPPLSQERINERSKRMSEQYDQKSEQMNE